MVDFDSGKLKEKNDQLKEILTSLFIRKSAELEVRVVIQRINFFLFICITGMTRYAVTISTTKPIKTSLGISRS